MVGESKSGTRMLSFLVVYDDDDDADGADDTDDDDDVDLFYDNIICTMMFHRLSLRYLYDTHIRSDHMILLMHHTSHIASFLPCPYS